MGRMANVLRLLRLGWIVCALGLVAGCGGGPQDPVLRDLESLGLVTDQGQAALEQSYFEITNRLRAGDVEVVETFLSAGLIFNVAGTIQDLERMRTSDNGADIDRAIEILQAADPVAAGRQLDEEARRLALDNAVADVPDSYHEFLANRCGRFVVIVALCVENIVDVLVQIFEEPAGPRRQFGMWVNVVPPSRLGRSTRLSFLVITEAAGGARVCLIDDPTFGDERLGGSFNDEGALSVGFGFGSVTIVVQDQGGVDVLDWSGRTYQRVTAPITGALEAYDRCFDP